MRVLLTGAGGFVGHHALEHLLRNTDWDIVVTDSFRHMGTSARIREVLEANPTETNRVEVVIHDLTVPVDPVTAHKLGDIELIFNIASESHVDRSISDPVPFVRNNVDLALNMLEYARTLPNLQALIQVSTDEVYGPAPVNYAHKEWEPVIPSNPYSGSKAAQEAIAISYWRTYDVPVIITNTMNIIGERQNVEKFIPKTIQAISNGTPVPVHAQKTNDGWVAGSRYYLHARNQADALMYIANLVISKGMQVRYSEGLTKPVRLNVVGELEVTNDEMVKLIATVLNKVAHLDFVDFHSSRPGHDLRYALDGTKLADLGWVPPVPFVDSLAKTVLWTVKHPEWLE